MSSALVDYGSSSDEDEEEQPEGAEREPPRAEEEGGSGSGRDGPIASPGQSGAVRLPDAAELLGMAGGSGCTSRSSGSESSSSRKRPDLNGSAHVSPPAKLPRRNLPPSRTSPDTAGGLLLPPQLRGRSNVVTDDIDKLFVRRQRDTSCGK